MRSIELPSPPKFLLIVVSFIAVISFCGLFIGEHYAKENKGNAATNNTKKYTLVIPIKQQYEGDVLLKRLKKYDVKASVEIKNVSVKVKTGYAVMEYFPESLGKIAAEALRTHNYNVTVESAGKDQVSVRVEGIYPNKEKCQSLAEELKSKGYIFKVHTYEQTIKKQSLSVVLKNATPSLSESITKEMTANGYSVDKQEYK